MAKQIRAVYGNIFLIFHDQYKFIKSCYWPKYASLCLAKLCAKGNSGLFTNSLGIRRAQLAASLRSSGSWPFKKTVPRTIIWPIGHIMLPFSHGHFMLPISVICRSYKYWSFLTGGHIEDDT